MPSAWDVMVERERLALVARNTARNGRRVAQLTHMVERRAVARAEWPSPAQMTALAASARRVRKKHFAATGVALGPGEAPGFVPREPTPGRVRWAGQLEVGRDEPLASHTPGAVEAAEGRLTKLDTVRATRLCKFVQSC